MAESLALRLPSSKEAVRSALEDLASRDRSGEILTALEHIPARAAEYAPMPEWVRPELAVSPASPDSRRKAAEAAQTLNRVFWVVKKVEVKGLQQRLRGRMPA